MDGKLLAFAVGLSALTALLFGLAPAWLSSKVDLNEALKQGTRGSTEGGAHSRLRQTFVILQVAVATILLAAAGPFSWLVAESQINLQIVGLIRGISSDPTITLITINVMLLMVGCILEPLPAMIIFVPTLLPLGAQLGIDPIQFGSVIVLNLMIGLLHPPIGLLLFVVSNVGRIPLKPIIVDSLPFLLWSIIVLFLAILYPPITTWLPSQIR